MQSSEEDKMTYPKQKGRKYSIMMYSHDGFGLGHIRRNYLIARHGVRKIPCSSFLMITGSLVPPFFYLPQGIDYIKLPSIIKISNGHWSPRTLSIGFDDFKNLRSCAIRHVAEIFKPDLFIADYTPTGIWHELVPTFEMLKNRSNPTQIILGLRDILDTPALTREFWQQERAYEFLKRYYDKILIYGCREVFDTAYHYDLLDGFEDKVTYCGYLCSQDTNNSNDEIRQKLGLKRQNLILITAGGGYDAYPIMQLSIKALKKVLSKVSAEAIFITGPLMNPESYELLISHSKDLPIHFLRFDDTLNYIKSADLVITMAGYNTLMDSVSAKKNIIVIPRSGPSAEQVMRAEIFQKLGLVTSLKPAEKVSSTELAEVIIERLNKPLVPNISISMNGLSRAVSEIKNMLVECIKV